MKLLYVVTLFICLGCSYAYAEYTFENKDYSIDVLYGEFNGSITQSIMMFLPPTQEFSPNVNVQIQPYMDSLDSYFDLSVNQMKQFKLKLLNSKKNKDSIEMEYSGKMAENHMHWFLVASKKNDLIYLVTATCLESQWETHKKKLIKCVKSFKLKK